MPLCTSFVFVNVMCLFALSLFLVQSSFFMYNLCSNVFSGLLTKSFSLFSLMLLIGRKGGGVEREHHHACKNCAFR